MSTEEKQRNPRQDKLEITNRKGKVVLVCRLPGESEWDAYLQAIKKGDPQFAGRQLLLATAIGAVNGDSLPRDQMDLYFNELLTKRPGIANKAQDLANMAGEVFDAELIDDPDDDEEELVQVTVEKVPYRFRCPEQFEWEECQKAISTKKGLAGPAMRKLCEQYFVGDVKQLKELFASYPAIIGVVQVGFGEISGASFETSAKKG